MDTFIDIFVTFIISILSGLGVGSGGLLMIWLCEIRNIATEEARSINLIFFIFSAGAALLLHIKKRKFFPSLIACMTSFGIIGSLVGTGLGAFLPSEITRRSFGVFLLLSGAYTLLSKKQKKSGERRLSSDTSSHNIRTARGLTNPRM